jgi:nucleoside-diphosphate-sugar epimerase
MRVLVTGSSGLLGAALAERLERRHEVVGLDLRPGRWTSVLGRSRTRDYWNGAHRSRRRRPYGVAPRAAGGRGQREEFVAVNVQGTLRLLEAATARGVRRFVYTSSTSVYGESLLPRDRAVWVTEELPARPRDVYDVTKLAAEGFAPISTGRRGWRSSACASAASSRSSR